MKLSGLRVQVHIYHTLLTVCGKQTPCLFATCQAVLSGDLACFACVCVCVCVGLVTLSDSDVVRLWPCVRAPGELWGWRRGTGMQAGRRAGQAGGRCCGIRERWKRGSPGRVGKKTTSRRRKTSETLNFQSSDPSVEKHIGLGD